MSLQQAGAFKPVASLAVAAWRSFGGSLMAGIFRRVFVTALAMSSGLKSSAVCAAAQCKTVKVHVLSRGQNVFWFPAKVVAAQNCIDVQPCFFGPLPSGKGFGTKSNSDITESIIRLFLSGRPLTISRFVISIIIDAVKSVAIWSRPHVLQKYFEVIPSITNLNPSSSVASVMRRRRCVAARPHRNPDFMKSCLGLAVSLVHPACILQGVR